MPFASSFFWPLFTLHEHTASDLLQLNLIYKADRSIQSTPATLPPTLKMPAYTALFVCLGLQSLISYTAINAAPTFGAIAFPNMLAVNASASASASASSESNSTLAVGDHANATAGTTVGKSGALTMVNLFTCSGGFHPPPPPQSHLLSHPKSLIPSLCCCSCSSGSILARSYYSYQDLYLSRVKWYPTTTSSSSTRKPQRCGCQGA